MKKQLVVLSFLNVAWMLNAQEKENNIEGIEIFGKFQYTTYKKVNENIEVITRKDIEISPAKSIDEILQHYAGMDIRRRGANGVLSDVSVRGGSFEQVLILLNGVRMNDSQTGHNSMNIPVDLSNVERIEIIKGPAARRFGQNAFAGVINIITKPNPTNIKISAEGGDFKTYSTNISSNFGNDKFSNLVQAGISNSDGYRENTDYKMKNVFYQNQYKIRDGKLGLQAGFSEKKFGSNGFYSAPVNTEYEETQASVVSASYQQKFKNFGLNSTAYWRRGQDMYLYNRENPSIYRNMHIGNNIGAEVNGSYKSFLGTTGLGVELRKEFLVSNRLGNHNRFVSQAFFEHYFSFFDDKLNISPGISWANFSNGGNFFYPGVDVSYTEDEMKLFFNMAKVHRIPTYTELYYYGANQLGNANLVSENAISSEGGLKYTTPNFDAKMSAFFRNTTNGIDWVKNSASEKWTAQNIGNFETKGFETEITHKPISWLNYSLGYTYIDNQFTQTSTFSRYALENLKHQFVAKLQTKFWKLSNEIVYRYNERVNLGSYNLLDAKVSFKNKGLEVYALANNITNSEYAEIPNVPMPKRWFHVGFSYDIRFKN